MEYLERSITVFDPSYVKPIYVVQGSNMFEIRITITDWNIPADADVYWQVATKTKGELNSASLAGNTIYINPYKTTFSEAGKGYLQVRIESDGKLLVSFSIDVFIQEDRVTSPVEGSNSDVIRVLVEQYVDEFTEDLFSRLEAEANSAVQQIENKGDEVIDSIPSDYTELEARVDELEMAMPSGITLSPLQKQTLMDMVNIIGTFTVSNAQEYIDAFNDAWNTSVTGIRLNKANLSFDGFGTEALVATLIPSDATGTITWTTSDAEVATVSNGLVEVVDNGSCTITASCAGYTATCAVTVANVPQRFSVTSTLTNCSISNAQSIVFEGSTYSATLLADTGYEMSSVICTMNGVAQTVTDNAITISNVTGNIEITAVAEQVQVYTSTTGMEYTKVFTLDTNNTAFQYLKNHWGVMENLEELTLVGKYRPGGAGTLDIEYFWECAPNLKKLRFKPTSVGTNMIKFNANAFNNMPSSLTYMQIGYVNNSIFQAGRNVFRNNGTSVGLSTDSVIGNTNGLVMDLYRQEYYANGGFGGTLESTTTINQYLYTDGSPLTA